CQGQDLSPRAYLITPVHSNAVTFTYSLQRGNILFDPDLPITGSSGRINVFVLGYFHSMRLFGRTANITALLPYTMGHFSANVAGTDRTVYRSGLMNAGFRFSANLLGGPAMSPGEFQSWRQKTLLGVSLAVVAPTGQYDPTVAVNPGTNRWAFKPELGLSQRWGHWLLDTYGAVWFFTTNHDFFSRNQYFAGTNTQSQAPIGATELHLSYDVKPRLWASIDGNYWYGGRTSINGVLNLDTLQANSRIGATASVPVSRHHSLKVSYSYGAHIRFGGNYHNVSLAWQYSWLGRPK
ncbi:MAG TPA: transporter, partial [Terriglobales bacterium]|nr:transporter [Terriglobales bacterium]